MQYDPIKKVLGKVFYLTPLSRAVFYRLLDLLLLRSWYIRRELRAWKKLAPSNANILDAGSGFGQYAWHLARMGKEFNVTGIDLKQEQVDDCNQFFARVGMANRVTFKMANLTSFDHQSAYDLVLSVDVMEHIEEDELVLKNLFNALKPGGMLLVSTPSDKGGSDVQSHNPSSVPSGFIDEHVRDGYNLDELRRKLFNAGFSRVDAIYSYGHFGSLAWKLSMKFPIILLNLSKVFFLVLPFYYLITFPVAFVLNSLDIKQLNSSGTGLIVKAFK